MGSSSFPRRGKRANLQTAAPLARRPSGEAYSASPNSCADDGSPRPGPRRGAGGPVEARTPPSSIVARGREHGDRRGRAPRARKAEKNREKTAMWATLSTWPTRPVGPVSARPSQKAVIRQGAGMNDHANGRAWATKHKTTRDGLRLLRRRSINPKHTGEGTLRRAAFRRAHL